MTQHHEASSSPIPPPPSSTAIRETKVWRAPETPVPPGKSHTFGVTFPFPVKLVEFQVPPPFRVVGVKVGPNTHLPVEGQKNSWEGSNVGEGSTVETTVVNTAPIEGILRTDGQGKMHRVQDEALNRFAGVWFYQDMRTVEENLKAPEPERGERHRDERQGPDARDGRQPRARGVCVGPRGGTFGDSLPDRPQHPTATDSRSR